MPVFNIRVPSARFNFRVRRPGLRGYYVNPAAPVIPKAQKNAPIPFNPLAFDMPTSSGSQLAQSIGMGSLYLRTRPPALPAAGFSGLGAGTNAVRRALRGLGCARCRNGMGAGSNDLRGLGRMRRRALRGLGDDSSDSSNPFGIGPTPGFGLAVDTATGYSIDANGNVSMANPAGGFTSVGSLDPLGNFTQTPQQAASENAINDLNSTLTAEFSTPASPATNPATPAGNAPVMTTSSGISSWISGSTAIGSVSIPNLALAGAGAIVIAMMSGKKRR